MANDGKSIYLNVFAQATYNLHIMCELYTASIASYGLNLMCNRNWEWIVWALHATEKYTSLLKLFSEPYTEKSFGVIMNGNE